MHEAINEVGNPEFFLTAIVARWHAVYSTFSWVNGGHRPPLALRANDTIEQLMTEPQFPLGLLGRERRFTRNQRRVEEGERLILHSDGITARRTPDGLFGLDGIERAVRGEQGRTPAAIARAIQEAVVSAAEDPLQARGWSRTRSQDGPWPDLPRKKTVQEAHSATVAQGLPVGVSHLLLTLVHLRRIRVTASGPRAEDGRAWPKATGQQSKRDAEG